MASGAPPPLPPPSLAAELAAAVAGDVDGSASAAGLGLSAPFPPAALSRAAVLSLLWHRLSGQDPAGRGYDVRALLGDVGRYGLRTPLAASSAELFRDATALFAHYALGGVAASSAAPDDDPALALTDFRALLKDAGVLPAGAGDRAGFEAASPMADLLFASVVRGAAARHDLLPLVGEARGLSFALFAWALARLAVWLAPAALAARLAPDDEDGLSLALFGLAGALAGARRVRAALAARANDAFAAGAALHELFSDGASAFGEPWERQAAILAGRHALGGDGEGGAAGVPPAVARLVAALLARAPADRPTLAEAAAEMQAAAAQL